MADDPGVSAGDSGLQAPGLEGTGVVVASADAEKAAKKKAKVRAAWIAFAGRILAQLIGAVATVVLGVYVVRTYGVADRAATAATTAPRPTPDRARSDQRLGLAVLPFAAYVPGGAQDYFTDGLTEALIADLSRIEHLRVVSRTSSMLYKGSQKPVATIARELDVDLLVEGAVAREADQVRVIVQLIDARTDTHVWARSYDRAVRTVLALQADVTSAIAQELHAVITPRQELAQARRAGVHPAAVDAYLRGRHAFHRRSPADLQEAAQAFGAAIAQEPRFAAAHASLAGTYCLMALDAFGAPAAPALLDRAEQAATTAIGLDPSSADAHLALAMVRHRRDWDWAGAERAFQRTFALHESHATAHQWYSIFLAEQERTDEARRHAERALALDPHAAPVVRTAGLVHLYARRLAEAERALRHALTLDPSSDVSRLMLAAIHVAQGRAREARHAALVVRDPGLQDQRLSLLAQAAVLAGDRGLARRLHEDAQRLPGTRSLVASARFAAAFGDHAGLIAAAEQAVATRTQLACALRVHPVFASLRGHPRLIALMTRVGLTP